MCWRLFPEPCAYGRGVLNATTGDPSLLWLPGESSATRPQLYFRALYFTTQSIFTVGYGDLKPMNGVEVLLASLSCLFGAVYYALVIANMTSVVGNLNVAAKAHVNQDRISTFMSTRKVPPAVQDETLKYQQYIARRQLGMETRRVMRKLPFSLQKEFMREQAALVYDVPLLHFAPLPEHHRRRLAERLGKEFLPRLFLEGSTIAKAGNAGCKIHIVSSGVVELTKDNAPSPSLRCHRGYSFGIDMILSCGELSTWGHTYKALTTCELLCLEHTHTLDDFLLLVDGSFRHMLERAVADFGEERGRKNAMLSLKNL